MDTVYVSFTRPDVAAVKMTTGPFFLASFAATIRQERVNENAVRVTYRYNFNSKPRWLASIINPIFQLVFRRETCRRLAAWKRFLEEVQPASDRADARQPHLPSFPTVSVAASMAGAGCMRLGHSGPTIDRRSASSMILSADDHPLRKGETPAMTAVRIASG